MTPEAFRMFALSLDSVVERQILHRNVFRTKGEAFATLHWPEIGWAVVKLDPEDQARLASRSNGLTPEPERGDQGITLIKLAAAPEETVEDALRSAWTSLRRRASRDDRSAGSTSYKADSAA